MKSVSIKSSALASLTTMVLLDAVAGLSGSAQASPIHHVMILSIDGLHEADLTDPATAQYLPNILSLAQIGIDYTNARTTSPSDSFPGTLALVTGATPKSTGVFYDDSYARNLYAPGTTLAQINGGAPIGTEVAMAENIDKNQALLSGGGATSGPGAYGKSAIDPTQLPVLPNGNPLQPWQYSKVNTIFDIAKAAGLTSAVMDKHPAAYNILQGPTGNAITDFYSPEINSNTAIIGGKLVDASTAPAGTPTGDGVNQLGVTTNNYLKTEAWDGLKQTALLNLFNNKNALGDTSQPMPSIIYSNFQEVSVAQKLGSNGTGVGGIDIVNNKEVVNPALQSALQTMDGIVGSLVTALKADGEYADTEIILTAKHGQDPRIGSATLIKDNALPDLLTAAGIQVAQATQDDVSLIWLSDQSQTAAAKALLQSYALTHPEIHAVLDGTLFGNPSGDNRTPDLIVQLNPGYIYVGNIGNTRKRAEHGNVFNIDDTAVPLIISGGDLAAWQEGLTVSELVDTAQIAPTVLADLGLDYRLLDGVRSEGTRVLPEPEPASLSLLGAGLLGLITFKRRT